MTTTLKHIPHYILLAIAGVAAVIITACSNEDTPSATEQQKGNLTFTIPIELTTYTASVPFGDTSSTKAAPASRATSDPGYDDELNPPTYLYVFANILLSDDTYAYRYTKCVTSATDWKYINADNELGAATDDPNSENQYSRWRYTGSVTLKLTQITKAQITGTADAPSVSELGTSRIYAIASNVDIESQLPDALKAEGTTDMTSTITAVTLNCTTGGSHNTDGSANSDAGAAVSWYNTHTIYGDYDLRDLYSSPKDDPANATANLTAANISNTSGMLYYDEANSEMVCTPVRLYHCAAKVDFTYEIAHDIQSTTAISSITATGLPTTLNVFAPTSNPAPSGTTGATADATAATTSLILGASASSPVWTLTPSNQWSGRAYAYVLQPSDGKISYTATFKALDGGTARTSKTSSITYRDNVFTTWYRINATIE